MYLNCLFYIPLFFFLLASPCSARQKDLSIGKFSEKSLVSWQAKQFSGETHYSFVNDKQKGWVIKAVSEGSASGLLREISVDITETPFLNWSNAFTGNSIVMALQSRRTSLGEWVVEKRNIQKDIFDCFGVEIKDIKAIAIMTDTDNSSSRAVAFYGDIFFTSE